MNNTPAEVLVIDPESLSVANCFLECQDVETTASNMGIDKELAVSILARKEVKAYIDGVFLSMGFNNKFRMRSAIDALIQQKFQELEESGTGSSKDIAELLEMSHRFTMQEYDKMIQVEKLRSSNVKNQLNVQINDNAGSNYTNLIENLLKNA